MEERGLIRVSLTFFRIATMPRRFFLKPDVTVPAPRFTINYADRLNEQQYTAATAEEGAFLVIAGAGTGKTRTLVYRVARLIESGVRPEEIVLLTFTRRAAREMLNRASALLDGRCREVEGGTFHSFCLKILRRHAPVLGFVRNFTIIDASDSADVIEILRASYAANRQRRFPDKGVEQWFGLIGQICAEFKV